MSLAVFFKDGTRMGCHVPFTRDFSNEVSRRYKDIETIWADGHELTYILSRLVGLPHSIYSTEWTGEFAQFIGKNFPWDPQHPPQNQKFTVMGSGK